MRTLLVNAIVVTMDDRGTILAPGRVLLEGSRILRVEEDRGARPGADRIVDCEHGILIPGLINGHTHAAMVAFRGYADDLPLKEWLERYIWPLENARVTPDLIRRAVALAAEEMLLAGITTYVDMYFFQDEAAEVLAEMGIRAYLGEGIIDGPTPAGRSPEEQFRRARDFIERWGDHPLIRPIMAPHAPYSCSERTLREANEMAQAYGIHLQIHLAEDRWELDQFQKERGMTPVRYLAELGLIHPRMSGAHVNYVTKEDIHILRDLGGHVVHNPESNMKLATGICPVPEYLSAGVNVALGTDGAVSNNDLDLFGEMRAASFLQKIHHKDPARLPAREVFWLATRGGARLLGREDLGQIAPDKKADLVLIRTDRPHLWNLIPQDTGLHAPDGVHGLPNVYSALVYSVRAEDVRHVWVNGELRVEDGVYIGPRPE